MLKMHDAPCMPLFFLLQERDHMTGEIERLKFEEAQAALEKKRAAEALMVEVHRSNAEQVKSLFTSSTLQYLVLRISMS